MSQDPQPQPEPIEDVFTDWVSGIIEQEVQREVENTDQTENVDIEKVTQRVLERLDIPEQRTEQQVRNIARTMAQEAVANADTGMSENRVIELIDQHSTGLTEKQTIELIEQHVSSPGNSGSNPSDAELASAVGDTLTNIEQTRQAIEFPGRRVGPSKPTGEYHTASLWGIHYSASKGHHFRRAIVDAQEAGSFTATLGKYDGDSLEVVAERDIDVDAGTNVITLNLTAPEGGEYLLTRTGTFPLRRGEWSGWDDHMMEGLQLHNGAKPGDFEDNSYWYYFFSCEIASGPDYHVDGGYPDPSTDANVNTAGYNGGP